MLGLSASAAAHATAGDEGARVVEEERLDERTVDLHVASPAMDDTLPVRVMFPPGYSAEAERTWPVLYLLHGGRDDYTSWTRETDVAGISAGSDAIVVMPEGGRAGNYADWHNHGRGGGPAWETFHTEELWHLLQTEYGAGDRRAVAGLSSGGLGALNYAARNPDEFSAAASFSGLLSPRAPGVRQLLLSIMRSEGLDPYALWGFPGADEERWIAHDPLSNAEALRGTELYLSSGLTGLPGELDEPGGDWDPLNIGEALSGKALRAMEEELDRNGVPATVNLYRDGTHSWPYWERELSSAWPMLMGSIGARTVPK